MAVVPLSLIYLTAEMAKSLEDLIKERNEEEFGG